ncbi:hypothetical protein HGM15179_007668 [Zosterops borbonicus]|uniref:Reverse transcriptase domain-containing protein n=1 Tax=Zosterops borbonicus TaxID=364589 RepID=A0A8K1LMX4_9PASS|nr:hypothetical protein HGM15179_007668 [Zosterops borbonicus]
MKEGERCSQLQSWDSSAGHGEAAIPQKPMEIHGNTEIHLQPVEKPYAGLQKGGSEWLLWVPGIRPPSTHDYCHSLPSQTGPALAMLSSATSYLTVLLGPSPEVSLLHKYLPHLQNWSLLPLYEKILQLCKHAHIGNPNRPGILEVITNWPEGETFGLLSEEEEKQVTRAEEAPPYNELPETERRYALFTDGSCRIVGANRKWKAAVWSPTRQVAQATEGQGGSSQVAELKAVQLALDIAEREKWPRLYLYTDSWMGQELDSIYENLRIENSALGCTPLMTRLSYAKCISDIITSDYEVDCLWARIKGKANKADILLGVCYRLPNQEEEVDNLFYKQLENVSGVPALVLVGDFNLPDIFWELHIAERRQFRKFLECTEDKFLLQLVNEPTWVFSGKTACRQDNCHTELVDSVREQSGPPVIQKEAVREMLSCLNVYKSTGPDGIYPRGIRELADELAKPLSIIYQQTWLTSEVPDDWKLDNMIPTRKKEDPGNYRPVSLTSAPNKIMEQFILRAIMQYLQDGQVIRPSQHGFRRGRSCLTNLVSFYDQLTRLVDAGKAVDVVYLDFSKAFDTVSHSTLLEKLAARGLDRSTLCWVRNWPDG